MTGRDAMMFAFDRLFERAAAKLHVECDEMERLAARRQFEERFSVALDSAQGIELEALPEEILHAMEGSIDQISPAQLAGHLAAIPIAHQAVRVLQLVAFRNAEQQLMRRMIEQADDRWGGN